MTTTANLSEVVTLMEQMPDILETLPDIVVQIVIVSAFLAVGYFIVKLFRNMADTLNFKIGKK